MKRLGLEQELVDRSVYERALGRFKEAKVALPTFAELSDPVKVPDRVRAALGAVGPDEPHPLNLYRVHWYNGPNRTEQVDVPAYLDLPGELTGTDARIVVALGDRFPMIGAHKVLAAYGCLAPRVITGQFDPTAHKAIWPSTGNYCRGGVAISRIMGCRGVAVLPEGMSKERFEWLERWVAHPEDIIRTPGTESNVKEIYDSCAELARDPKNIIFNQFAEYGNHLVHYFCTGAALGRVFESLRAAEPGLRLRAFTSASGSAGTLGAGDYLKEQYGAAIVAVEALECPTMLSNGFGEHNIQGIGDKHIPLIHNVMNTDVVTAISDQATDQLLILFNTEAGRDYLINRRRVPSDLVAQLVDLGLSSICNVLAAIKSAEQFGLGSQDVIITVATDGAAMYRSEVERLSATHYPEGFDAVSAGEAFGRNIL
ncbi:MAG TPA: pyridoxal-phosphate dependent enzyme, partial [Actinomycetota bacterium]|nr:pyridoxal-phosphate dependent enzyme [Actinomycetota bacterium]